MAYSVLCCGSNGNYQLGVSDDDDHDMLVIARFRRDDGELVDYIDSKPINIVCGGNHTFILLESGTAYACGENTYGQCAIGAAGDNVVHFHQVPGKWKFVAAGWEFSVLVDNNGRIYSCGLGQKGELGQGPEASKSESLEEVIADFGGANVVDIKASLNHCIVKLDNGELFGWGNSRKGQLGTITEVNQRGKLLPFLWTPHKLDFGLTSPVVDYGVGRDLTSILTSNTINIYGKLQDTIHEKEPILSLKSMWSSIHYSHKTEGTLRLKSYGNNSHGQIFPGDSIKDYQIGSEHGLVLADDNSVYAWGWGEHGNCGIHTKTVSSKVDDQVTFDYLNPLYCNGPVVLLGCGCATSWIVVPRKR